jgi:hypothetical protein
MLRLALGILAVFFIALFESGLNNAVYITVTLLYCYASFMVPFKVANIIETGVIEFRLIDYLGIVIILSGIGLGFWYWGFSRINLLLFSPFLSGSIILLITYLYLNVGSKKT